MSYSAPERLLRSLGIEKPEDIDLEAVAWSVGAKVKYRPLKSCEARICGYGDKAIISVDSTKIPQRQARAIILIRTGFQPDAAFRQLRRRRGRW